MTLSPTAQKLAELERQMAQIDARLPLLFEGIREQRGDEARQQKRIRRYQRLARKKATLELEILDLRIADAEEGLAAARQAACAAIVTYALQIA